MILTAFSKYLKEFKSDVPAVIILSRWLKDKLSKPAEDNIEKVIHREISLFVNKKGGFMLIGNSESGRILVESLYNYALSYEQQNFNRWIHNKKASDFKKNK